MQMNLLIALVKGVFFPKDLNTNRIIKYTYV